MDEETEVVNDEELKRDNLKNLDKIKLKLEAEISTLDKRIDATRKEYESLEGKSELTEPENEER